MNQRQETIWVWLQAKGRIYKVISNPQKGIIRVFDEKGALVMEQVNLSRNQVEIVEKSFLSVVAKRLTFPEPKIPSEHFDPMVA